MSRPALRLTRMGIVRTLAKASLVLALLSTGAWLAAGKRVPLPQPDLTRVPTFDLSKLDPVPLVHSARRTLHRALPQSGPREVNVVLSREGGTLTAGPEYGPLGLSSVALATGHFRIEVPPLRISDARWQRFQRCVRSRFAPYAINFRDTRPPGSDAIVVHVGGSPSMFGHARTVHGIAPHAGRVLANASVFVFTHHRPSTAAMCNTAAHEIGHALGLDHTRLCSDIMSYTECGPKRFRDRADACGEHSRRECYDGTATQNSAAALRAAVGTRNS